MPTVWAIQLITGLPFCIIRRFKMTHGNWNGFNKGVWQDEINVRDFIQQNYTEYTGDDSFLKGATKRTKELMGRLNSLWRQWNS